MFVMVLFEIAKFLRYNNIINIDYLYKIIYELLVVYRI
jgi:hypothetical protein